MEIALAAAAFLVPPVLIILSDRKVLPLLIGVLWFWGMMVLSCEYTLATDPEYDSIAPGIIVFFGWLLGLWYCVPCYAISLAIKSRRQKRTQSTSKISEGAVVQPDVQEDC
jgi:hypothetical protein